VTAIIASQLVTRERRRAEKAPAVRRPAGDGAADPGVGELMLVMPPAAGPAA